MKIKTVLISQAEPSDISFYDQMSQRHKVKFEFKPFVEIETASLKEIRAQKIELSYYTSIIFTTRTAVDHFFKIAEQLRFKVSEDMKYFCLTESISAYLQRYIVCRKRKIYVGGREFSELLPSIKKHKDEKYLFPTSDTLSSDIEQYLNDLGIEWKRGIFFNNVFSKFSGVRSLKYDMIVFYGTNSIDSLFANFPNFKQGTTKIAVYGQNVLKYAQDLGLEVELVVPTPETSSMTSALDTFIEKNNARVRTTKKQ